MGALTGEPFETYNQMLCSSIVYNRCVKTDKWGEPKSETKGASVHKETFLWIIRPSRSKSEDGQNQNQKVILKMILKLFRRGASQSFQIMAPAFVAVARPQQGTLAHNSTQSSRPKAQSARGLVALGPLLYLGAGMT